MREPGYLFFVVLFAICLLMAIAGLYFLSRFNTLFKSSVRNETLRQNIVVWLIVFCLLIAMAPLNYEIFYMISRKGVLYTLVAEVIISLVNVIFVFNTVRLVSRSPFLRSASENRKRAVVIITLIVTCVLVNLPLNYIANDFQAKNMKFSVLYSIYLASVTGMVYTLMSYMDADRNRKLQEKELEVSKLSELKTKAELDALQSKVNPHFLYNALNSIAELSVTDGKKARDMTIALADLLRYSINYSNNNFTTVNEELAMAEVYLKIEKIRFEDKLFYTVDKQEEAGHYLVPRFILQPVVENAVKHGLKVTGQMTNIRLEVKLQNGSLILNIADNGPKFPAELSPGYGVKSVYDKMDLLFPGAYDIYFINEPIKHLSIHIHKLIKNESV